MLKLVRRSAKRGPIAGLDFYSRDYFAARDRFVAVCERLGFTRHVLPVEAPSPNGQPLAIDVAIAGSVRPARALVVSSGVHGVEGLFGSAVQLAFLESLSANWQPADGTAVVFIHAVNPFGFAWQRRFNEDNVDLNRNFLRADEVYAGAPPLCGAFRRALMRHPTRARLGLASSRMALLALRHGVQSFWENLPVGQYEYPDWLFFGGRARSQSAQGLERILPVYLDRCEEAVHLDFHTGLGRWANCKLLLNELETAESATWWNAHFGAANVSEASRAAGTYQIRGGFGAWLQATFPQCLYRFDTAEFVTYSPMRVIGALTEELHWHAKLGTQEPLHRARCRLTEAFVPRDWRWRTQALDTGISLIHRAAQALPHSIDTSAGLRTAS
jgi:predicted deacylase